MVTVLLLALLVQFLGPPAAPAPAPWRGGVQDPAAEVGTVYDRVDDDSERPDGTAPHHPKSQPPGRRTLEPPDYAGSAVGVGVDDDHGQSSRSCSSRAPPVAA